MKKSILLLLFLYGLCRPSFAQSDSLRKEFFSQKNKLYEAEQV